MPVPGLPPTVGLESYNMPTTTPTEGSFAIQESAWWRYAIRLATVTSVEIGDFEPDRVAIDQLVGFFDFDLVSRAIA